MEGKQQVNDKKLEEQENDQKEHLPDLAKEENAKEIGKLTSSVEQKPFLTQTELLIKMKAGQEEEVKR